MATLVFLSFMIPVKQKVPALWPGLFSFFLYVVQAY